MTDLMTRATAAPATTARPVGDPASALAGTTAAALVVVVAPSTGRYHPVEGPGDAPLPRGGLLGHVTGGKGRADEVRVPVESSRAELLVRPGQLVTRGQGLAWMRRDDKETTL